MCVCSRTFCIGLAVRVLTGIDGYALVTEGPLAVRVELHRRDLLARGSEDVGDELVADELLQTTINRGHNGGMYALNQQKKCPTWNLT